MIESLLVLVENRMRDVVDPSHQDGRSTSRAALGHLAAGGSRVRARLCLHASVQLGLPNQDAVTLAAICELLHNASLIQDDLIDRAATRRDRASIWVAFDDATAVCAGDLLLAGAFALVGELRRMDWLAPVLALVHRRTRDVILGQGAEQASTAANLAIYQSIAVGKSGSLLSLPLELPLLLSGNQSSLATAKRAAENFSVAYQMLDDLNDYEEDSRDGALNAVSLAITLGSPSYAAACALVCERAEELLQSAIGHAFDLPMDCGSAMVSYAEDMRLALQAHRPSGVHTAAQWHHAG